MEYCKEKGGGVIVYSGFLAAHSLESIFLFGPVPSFATVQYKMPKRLPKYEIFPASYIHIYACNNIVFYRFKNMIVFGGPTLS
jgi:hypothetical protein